MMIDYDGTKPKSHSNSNQADGNSGYVPVPSGGVAATSNQSKISESQDNDNVFSDSEEEEAQSSTTKQAQSTSGTPTKSDWMAEQIAGIKHGTENLSLAKENSRITNTGQKSDGAIQEGSDFKAIAADASVFSFGDEDYESE